MFNTHTGPTTPLFIVAGFVLACSLFFSFTVQAKDAVVVDLFLFRQFRDHQVR